MLDDSAPARAAGRAGRQTVADRFELEGLLDQYARLIESTAGDAPLMFRNMAYASVSAASAVLLLILYVVAGRTLGEVEFGKFSFALALGMIFETLMDFGLHQVTIRAVARDKSRATELLHHTLGIKLVWMVGALFGARHHRDVAAARMGRAHRLLPASADRWCCGPTC